MVAQARRADIDWLSREQLALIDEVVQRHWDEDSTDLRNLSHTFPGCEIAEDGEEIPYPSVFISRELPNQEDIDWGLTKARDLSLA